MSLLPANNLEYPVRIEIQGTSGSGFFLSNTKELYLITAKHVLFQKGLELLAKKATLTATSSVVLELDCEVLLANGSLRKHDKADVAICLLGHFQVGVPNPRSNPFSEGCKIISRPNGSTVYGLSHQSVTMFDDVKVSNEIILFGYPASLGHEAQIDRKRPLLRKGIVAGKTEDRRVVIDCPVYFGNSGGLVIEITEPKLGEWKAKGIGVATEMVPFVEEMWSKQFNAKIGTRFENSG